jgi:hypothetical protein
MIRVALVTITALLLATGAHAADPHLPKEFVGKWCFDENAKAYSRTKSIKGCNSSLEITPQRLSYSWEDADEVCLLFNIIPLPKEEGPGVSAGFICRHKDYGNNTTKVDEVELAIGLDRRHLILIDRN